MDWGEWFSLPRTRDFFSHLSDLSSQELTQLATMSELHAMLRIQGRYTILQEVLEITQEELEEWKKS